MARPRIVTPGASYLVTRRTYQRTFRLRPAPIVNTIIMYCLANAAADHGIVIHAVIVMSNHHHIVCTDVHGVLPDFLRDFHRTTAKALNALQRQKENLWAVEHTSTVLLPSIDDIVAAITYVVANPVRSGLIKDPENWPGLLVWQPGSTRFAKRPEVYFGSNSCAPESVKLRIEPPSMNAEEQKDWGQRIHLAVAQRVREACEEVRAKGIEFLGAAAVMAKSFLHRAKTYEAKGKTKPILSAKDSTVRKVIREMQQTFYRSYREALLAWKSGDRLFAFPFGTWWMRVHHCVEVLPSLH